VIRPTDSKHEKKFDM